MTLPEFANQYGTPLFVCANIISPFFGDRGSDVVASAVDIFDSHEDSPWNALR